MTMTCGIMQPYLFPYLGYWQLIRAVDQYYIYDDVNYFKQGYINRNSILSQGEAQKFTLELFGASQNKFINQIEVGNNAETLLTKFRHAYAKAPHFAEVFPLLEEILRYQDKNLGKFLGNSIIKIAKALGITTPIHYTSDFNLDQTLKKEEKVIHMCKAFNADHYINAIGGQELYSKENFTNEGITLHFISMNSYTYPQFGTEFVPHLSIIDVMMFNDNDTIHSLLENYTLV